jgi:hypothetical protein
VFWTWNVLTELRWLWQRWKNTEKPWTELAATPSDYSATEQLLFHAPWQRRTRQVLERQLASWRKAEGHSPGALRGARERLSKRWTVDAGLTKNLNNVVATGRPQLLERPDDIQWRFITCPPNQHIDFSSLGHTRTSTGESSGRLRRGGEQMQSYVWACRLLLQMRFASSAAPARSPPALHMIASVAGRRHPTTARPTQ